MNIIKLWILLTVTYGGAVNRSEPFKSLYLCQEARSLALTGQTIEENAHLAAQRVAAEKKWRQEHPPRLPRTADERKWCGKDVIFAGSSSGWSCLHGMVSEPSPFDLVGLSPSYSPEHGEAVEVINGQWVLKHANDVKVAECVPDIPVTRQGR